MATDPRDEWVQDALTGMVRWEGKNEDEWTQYFRELLETPGDKKHPSYHVAMLSNAMRSVKDHDVAEEIVQKATIKFWQAARKPCGGFDPAKALGAADPAAVVGAYLKMIVTRLCLDHFKHLETHTSAAVSVEGSTEINEEYVLLKMAISRLPKQYAAVVMLAMAGHTFEDIGRLMGVSRNTTFKRWTKAKLLLRRYLEDDGDEAIAI